MFPLRWFVLVFTVLLAACGGGEQMGDTEDTSTTSTTSTSTSSTTEIESTTEPVLLEGQASKGVVQYGQVDAYVLENGSRRHVGSTQTDAEGHYSLQLDDFSDPAVVEITPVGDGSSKMICDAVDGCGSAGFGESFPLPTDFLVSTLVTPSDSDLSTVPVTPLTHLASEWAQAMPGEVDDQQIELARGRVAGILQLDAGFIFQDVPDVTDSQALDGATTAEARHSLLSAGFSERAADTDDTLQDVINGYSNGVNAYAGQIDHYGTYSLYELYDAAYEIANTRGILSGIQSELDLQIAALSEGMSETTTAITYTQADFDQASTTLDNLDHYLNTAGIDETAGFIQEQYNTQLKWLESSEMILGQSDLELVEKVAMISILVGIHEDTQETLPAEIVLQSGDIESVYNFDLNELTIQGQDSENSVDITVDMTSIKGQQQTYDFGATGTVQDSNNQAQFSGTLTLDFHNTDLNPIIADMKEAIAGNGVTDEEIDSAFHDLFKDFQLTATLNGSASIAKLDDETFGFDMTNVELQRNWNLPGLNSDSRFATLQGSNGSLETPNGDWIADNADNPEPGLAVDLGPTSTVEADLATEVLGLPRIEVKGNVELDASDQLGNTVQIMSLFQDHYDAILASSDFSSDLPRALQLLKTMDFPMLQQLGILGVMTVTVEDPERGNQIYEFDVQESWIDVSLPSSTDTAFRFHRTASQGGYITSGGTLVATATFNSAERGLSLYLSDGSKRQYFLGTMDN